MYSSIIVTVHSPCDQEWRELYPDTWMFEANRAIEEADALMYDKFSIDLRSEKQTAWTGNTYSGNGDTLLDEAWAEEGLNGCNLMIAFTGKNFPYGGWGYVGGAGCLVIDQGYPANASVARHEVGHNYGCPDQYNDPNPPVCFMNDCYNQFNDNITRDGGESWEQIEMPDEKAEVKKIEVTDELITMTVEKDAEIWVMKSSDLGESWSTVQSLQ